jgi:hypothetical protein
MICYESVVVICLSVCRCNGFFVYVLHYCYLIFNCLLSINKTDVHRVLKNWRQGKKYSLSVQLHLLESLKISFLFFYVYFHSTVYWIKLTHFFSIKETTRMMSTKHEWINLFFSYLLHIFFLVANWMWNWSIL